MNKCLYDTCNFIGADLGILERGFICNKTRGGGEVRFAELNSFC